MRVNILRSYILILLIVLPFLYGCNSAIGLYKKGEKKYRALEYQTAIGFFEKSKAKGYNPASVNYAMAESYRFSNRLVKAEPFYKAAIDARTKQDGARFYYASALKAEGKYKEAAQQFDIYAKSGSNLKNRARAKKETENLAGIEDLVNTKTPFEVQNLSELNTSAAEFSPVVFKDELVITASRKDRIYKATGTGMLGLYEVKFISDSTFDKQIKLFSENIFDNSVNEGTPAFSPDGRRVVFARSNGKRDEPNTEVDLYMSVFSEGKWSEPRNLDEINSVVNGKYSTGWDGCPAFSGDGKTLYFASNREGTFGGLDLYRATIDASGKFRSTTNLGSSINTAGNEMFPYISDDGKLYFSSDGLAGLGGLDIFVANKKDGEITVKNLGVPINSIADDFGIVYKTPSFGYFSSNRDGGKGDDDIYIFRDKKTNMKLVNYFLAGTVITTEEIEETKEKKEIPLSDTKVKVMDGDKVVREFTTNAEGKFGKVKVLEGKIYALISEKKPDYLTKRDEFSMIGRAIPQELLVKPVTDTTFEIKILLDKKLVDHILVLENILYDFDKANIREDAAEELDKLVNFLSDNADIKIELSSHTDDRGNIKYNEDLSQRRAESAVNYIVSKGINRERITAKGYGKSRQLIENAQTEEEHQKNRRTEIKILEVN